MPETATPTVPIFRLGRHPDPRDLPDWSRAHSDGTFGNRFDDPTGYYRVLYASSQRRLGLEDLDVAILQQGKPRRLTQLSSLEVYKAGLNGIYYRSRYGHDLEELVLFEPFQVRKQGDSEAIRVDDPDILAACELLRIQIGN